MGFEFRLEPQHDDVTRKARRRFTRSIKAALLLGCVPALLAAQASQAQMVEWKSWGADNAQTRFSTASEITPANVNKLKIAWEWKHGEKTSDEYGGTRPGSFNVTPLMIDNVLYLTTPYNRVVALDADSGKQLWAFDPDARKLGQPLSAVGFTHRGPVYWSDGKNKRIFLNSRDRLYSIDATTGKLDTTFGVDGSVNLIDKLGRPVNPKFAWQNSPATVFRDLVIVGSTVPDQVMFGGDQPGAVQAFNVRTGKREWVWFTLPHSPKDEGANTWERGSLNGPSSGHANVWGAMSVDEARGILYVPTSTPGADYYGGERPGANLYAESLVALDAATGKRKWHFQAVHHGIWDYDFGAAPNLLTINVDGRKIDAVAETSKQGFVYVFDRVTGKPVWPIVERPVQTDSDVPGEKLFPTQPFPTKPPPYVPQGVTLDDANDLTPQIKAMAIEEMKRYRLGPLFTPTMMKGTLQRPWTGGTTSWAGSAVDPEQGMLFIKASTLADPKWICQTRDTKERPWVSAKDHPLQGYTYIIPCEGKSPIEPSKLQGIPLTKPPYGILVAYNLNKGEIAWSVPFGDSPVLRNHPLLKDVALPDRLGNPAPAPGPSVTKSGLVFIGGGEPYLYAFDSKSGREIWRGDTPYRTSGNPIIYTSRAGKEFVVIATGSGSDASLVAFALDAPAAKSVANTPAPSLQAGLPSVAEGAKTFARVCSACHGVDARGGAAPTLIPLKRDDFEVHGIVREGRGMMPPVGFGEVSDDQLKGVIAFLKSETAADQMKN